MTSLYCKSESDSLEVEFMKYMDIPRQAVCAANPDKCYFGKSPTLGEMTIVFNRQYTMTFIARHIQSILATVGDKDNVPADVIGVLSHDIISTYPWLTASEFLLFCSRVRVGKYGKLAYGQITVDDIVSKITNFLAERQKEITMYTRKQEEDERNREYERREKYAVSHDEAYRLINLAADGDIEAQHRLHDDPKNWSHRMYFIIWLTDDDELKRKISEYFSISTHFYSKTPYACFPNERYKKFLEGIEKGYYKIV